MFTRPDDAVALWLIRYVFLSGPRKFAASHVCYLPVLEAFSIHREMTIYNPLWM